MIRPVRNEGKMKGRMSARPRMIPLASVSRAPSRGLFAFALFLSLGLHGIVAASLLVSWDFTKEDIPPPPPEKTVEMSFESPEKMEASEAAKANTKTPKPRAPAPEDKEGPPSDRIPRKAPIEEPPPPPPPPQAVPPPSGTTSPELDKTPLPSKMESPALKALQTPTTSHPEQRQDQVAPPTPFPQKTDELPKKIIPSHLTQPFKAKKNEPDTHALMATLDQFKLDQKQTHPPKARPNPQAGGARDGGGVPEGKNITKDLSPGEQQKVGQWVQRCYKENLNAKNYASFQAHLVVTIDEEGVVRHVDYTPQTQKHVDSDAVYRVMTEGAADALLDPNCSRLPLPKSYLGQIRQLNFNFRP